MLVRALLMKFGQKLLKRDQPFSTMSGCYCQMEVEAALARSSQRSSFNPLITSQKN